MSKQTNKMHPEGSAVVHRRAFLQTVAGAAAGAAAVGGISETAAAEQVSSDPQMPTSKETSMPHSRGGHLYMQTNEIRNAVVHYRWSPAGTLTELGRVATGGAGTGTFKPISGQESAPNAFEGAGSVILTPDRRFLLGATIRSPASAWTKAAGSHRWT